MIKSDLQLNQEAIESNSNKRMLYWFGYVKRIIDGRKQYWMQKSEGRERTSALHFSSELCSRRTWLKQRNKKRKKKKVSEMKVLASN